MLNRLYIVVGVLAILVIAAAFIVPRFIQWGDYRGRMEMIASETLGAPVEIVGEIAFSLLPQPQLQLAEVRVGPPGAPVLTIAQAHAEFSLIDFLRDRYRITRLALTKPSLEVRIGEDGALEAGIVLPDAVSSSNVSVQSAEIVDGDISIWDDRAGDAIFLGELAGELRMDALRGPFAFQGSARYEEQRYSSRISTSALDADGSAQLSLYLTPADERFSLTAEGRLAFGAEPVFTGKLGFSQSPPAAAAGEEADLGRGDLLVIGDVTATPARVLLTTYTIVPDENRPATRLTGAAEIRLGASRSFNAVISGGVVGLPPRDATADQSTIPHEVIRLLADVPVPSGPGIPGTLGVDIADVDLRAFALRSVRFDASTDGDNWRLDSFSAQLPGNTTLRLSGLFTEAAGRPNFAGNIGLTTPRLDTLSQLWRRAEGAGPLFGMPGSLSARLSLVGETLSVSDAILTLDEQSHAFTAEIGFAPATRHLNVRSALGVLDATQSAALAALLPDIGADARFGVTFPKGRFEVSAEAMTIAGLPGRALAARGSWEGGVLALDSLTADDLGGVGLDVKLTAFGSFARPEFSGTARVAIADAGAPGLARLYDAMGTPPAVRSWLAPSLPAELDLRLDAPSGQGGQSLAVSGRLGAAAVTVDADLGLGFVRALSGPLAVRIDLRATDATALTAQLGLGEVSVTPEDAPLHVVAIAEGTASNSFETTVRLEGGGESLAFSGNVVAGDLRRLTGNGNLQVALSELSGLVERLGGEGLSIPPLNGSARVDFEALDSIRLRDIAVTAGSEPVTGDLRWSRANETARVDGALAVPRLEPAGLLGLLAGPAAAINTGAGFWPDGPVATGGAARTSTGRIDVSVGELPLGGGAAVTEASFALGWDATSIRVRDFSGTIGGGTARAELAVCCAGPLPQLQFSGRASLVGVSFDGIVPAPVAAAIDATVDAAARFEGTGDSLHAAIDAMTGEGSYTLDGFTVRGVDPAAFRAIASLEAVLDMEPASVQAAIVERLDDNPFDAGSVSGAFTIAGGVLRSPNIAIEGETARLFGTANLALDDLGLSGSFAMSPTVPSGPGGVLTESTASIAASLGGTLPDPQPSFDVAGVVDTIMVRAYEAEVERLERLRAEDEARQRAAAEERARIVAEEAARRAAAEEAARLKAEEDARLAAEAEAARLAEEEAARQAAEEEAARRAAEQAEQEPALQPGFNLNFTPAPPASQF